MTLNVLNFGKAALAIRKKNLQCVLQKSSCVNLTSNLVTTASITGVFLLSTLVIVIAPPRPLVKLQFM